MAIQTPLSCSLVPLDNLRMSGQPDPWDAMVQNGDSDEEYIPTGVDGIDDEDQDDGYEDIDEDVISDDDEFEDNRPCIPRSACVTSAESGTGHHVQMSNTDTMESQMLRLSLHCENSSIGRVQEW